MFGVFNKYVIKNSKHFSDIGVCSGQYFQYFQSFSLWPNPVWTTSHCAEEVADLLQSSVSIIILFIFIFYHKKMEKIFQIHPSFYWSNDLKHY